MPDVDALLARDPEDIDAYMIWEWVKYWRERVTELERDPDASRAALSHALDMVAYFEDQCSQLPIWLRG
jgi:hypothetical protein